MKLFCNVIPDVTHPCGSAVSILSQEFASGVSGTEGARVRDTSAHMARRDLFTSGLEMERSEQISRKEAMRESAERISMSKRVSEKGLLEMFQVVQGPTVF